MKWVFLLSLCRSCPSPAWTEQPIIPSGRKNWEAADSCILLAPVSFLLTSSWTGDSLAVHLLSLMKVTASQSYLAYFPWRGRAAHHCQSNAQTFSLQSRHEVSGEWRLSGLPAHLPSPTNPGALHQRQQRKNEWAKWLPREQSDLSVFWNSFIPPI